jgi:hypothetical protein
MKITNVVSGCVLAAALAAAPHTLLAQGEPARPAGPTVGPPIQRIATASALSTEQLGSIQGVRELADGRVLLNDGARRRLLLMDTTLKLVEVVLDSLSEISNTYGTRPGALLAYRADSTLFVDPASYAMVVLDPAGKIARIRSVWRVEHVSWFGNPTGPFGTPGLDAKGRMVYRVPARPAPPKVAPPSGVPWIPTEPDSAFIIGMNLDTRKADTLGSVRVPRSEMRIRQMATGGFSFDMVTNPLPTSDDWAVLPDGTVAFVRWRDYRVEYLNPDGTITSSAKLPFEWQRLLDDDKKRMVDSVKAVQQRSAMNSYVTSMIRWVNMYGKGYPKDFKVPEGYVLPPGLVKDWILPEGVKFPERYVFACAPGVEPTLPAGVNPGGPVTPGGPPGQPSCFPAPVVFGGGQTPPAPTIRPIFVLDPSELPDYKPPISSGSVRADMDGNLWIRTIPAKPVPGGTVYDIVSRQGELVNRLQLPPGYSLVGFGRGKVVYLSMRDASGIHLARVRLR